MQEKQFNGFTLIELLVVIAIIGILASATLASLNAATKKARDTRRIEDMKQVTHALALYFDAHGTFPTDTDDNCNGGWDSSENLVFIHVLTLDGYMSHDVVDPKVNAGCGNYQYHRYPAGSFGCDPKRGAFYVLEIENLDTIASGQSPDSPGFACPSRDWANFSEWVTGDFES